MGEWKDYCQQRSVGIGMDRHIAVQFAESFSHSGDADASLPGAFVQLAQGLGRHAVSVILHFKPNLISCKSQADIRFRAAGVAVNIGQGLLQRAKQSDFNITAQPPEVRRQAKVDGHAAALGETFDEPAGGGAESGFIEQGRMK
jgi:hypothetical protein